MLFLLALLAALLAAGDASSDVHATIEQLITEKGYPYELHNITTADGFVLHAQRIPHGRNGAFAGTARPPVILQHGLLDSAFTWVMNSAEESLAFILADAGFDVFLTNSRGNLFSMENTHYSKHDLAFWAWSWAEMARYDVPANIDHVLQVTGYETLSYVGHSQGTTQGFAFWTTGNWSRSYADKVNQFVALAPVAYIKHQRAFLLRVLADLHADLLFELLGDKSFLPSSKILETLFPFACKIVPGICSDIIGAICGFDKADFNETRIPVYVGHYPSGTSVRDAAHYAQEVRSGEFAMYDFGSKHENEKHYGQETPPQYDLSAYNTQVPLLLVTGNHDDLADTEDIARLKSELPPGSFQELNIPAYSHLSFVWGTDANTLIYPNITATLKAASGMGRRAASPSGRIEQK